MKREPGSEHLLVARGCARNCDRRALLRSCATGSFDPGRPGKATTREPGDLPVAVVLRADGMFRAIEVFLA
jgi:hypothetical protein